MRVKLGTFNLNNLFSRYNFKGEIDAVKQDDTGVDSQLTYEFGPGSFYKIRTYKGKLVQAKKPAESQKIADRIANMDVDVLAVQEVEDIDTLRQFNRETLGGLYPHCVLIEGNDPRLIDIGVLSKLPLGAMSSWQAAVHPDDPTRLIFGRDLLEVQVLNPARTRLLFTVFNNHLKSHYVDWRDDPVAGQKANDERRLRQAQVIADIVKQRTRPNSRYAIVGDMNDPVGSQCLSAFTQDKELGLVDALADPQETRPPKDDTPPPATRAWTHRYKRSGQPAEYELYDQIWVSEGLAAKQTEAWIDRRTKHGGDGSDHDPAWITLEL